MRSGGTLARNEAFFFPDPGAGTRETVFFASCNTLRTKYGANRNEEKKVSWDLLSAIDWQFIFYVVKYF